MSNQIREPPPRTGKRRGLGKEEEWVEVETVGWDGGGDGGDRGVKQIPNNAEGKSATTALLTKCQN